MCVVELSSICEMLYCAGMSRREIIMPKGKIKRLIGDRGYGFISTAQGGDLFFHRNQLQGVEYDSLREGQDVEFEVGQGRDGRPLATKVRLAPPKSE
jgi:CspA family cold shock protein